MAYRYAPQGAPTVGNGLGGIPARKEVTKPAPKVIYLYSGSGDFQIPAGYSQIRWTVVGAGGSGAGATSYGAGGGGGGALAMSAIMPCAPGQILSYQIGIGGPAIPAKTNQAGYDGGDTIATFNGVRLVGGGGKGGRSYVPYDSNLYYAPGGVASGGVVNFRGGRGGAPVNSSSSSAPPGPGGGAAGTGSNGGDHTAGSKTLPDVSSGPDAGGAAGWGMSDALSSGGAGSGAMSGTTYQVTSPSSVYTIRSDANSMITSNYGVIGFPSRDVVCAGEAGVPGDGGLGGGGGAGANRTVASGKGGDGCLRIELW